MCGREEGVGQGREERKEGRRRGEMENAMEGGAVGRERDGQWRMQ